MNREEICARSGMKPELLDAILDLAEQCDLQSVILFGSRARGGYRSTSDVDLAISGGEVDRFTLEVEELPETLLKFDVIDLDGMVQESLLNAIELEGVSLYEKV